MFDITFLGTSGGPVEGVTCAILLKPSHISYNQIVSEGLHSELVCVDAGSGLYSLSEIIHNEKQLHGSPYSRLKDLYPDTLDVHEYVEKDLVVTPFVDLGAPGPSGPAHHQPPPSPFKLAWSIFDNLSNYLITHPHLDHISALAINSAGIKVPPKCAGAPAGGAGGAGAVALPRPKPTKAVIGSDRTINALQEHIFNGVIWPNMPSFKIINLVPQDFDDPFKVGASYSVTMFSLSHGKIKNNLCSAVYQPNSPVRTRTPTPTPSTPSHRHAVPPSGSSPPTPTTAASAAHHHHRPLTLAPDAEGEEEEVYESSAFLIAYKMPISSPPLSKTSSNNGTNNTEAAAAAAAAAPPGAQVASPLRSSMTASSPSILIFGDFESDIVSQSTYNLHIWRHVAPLVLTGQLRAIVLECSSCSSQSHIELYGHLMPLHLIKELHVLAAECTKLSPSASQPLKDLNIIVNHVKESTDGEFDPRKKVQRDLDSLNKQYKLGVKFSIALAGVTLRL